MNIWREIAGSYIGVGLMAGEKVYLVNGLSSTTAAEQATFSLIPSWVEDTYRKNEQLTVIEPSVFLDSIMTGVDPNKEKVTRLFEKFRRETDLGFSGSRIFLGPSPPWYNGETWHTALAIEKLWHEVSRNYPDISTMCTYPTAKIVQPKDTHVILDEFKLHTHFVPDVDNGYSFELFNRSIPTQ
jgi:hypothetical protein